MWDVMDTALPPPSPADHFRRSISTVSRLPLTESEEGPEGKPGGRRQQPAKAEGEDARQRVHALCSLHWQARRQEKKAKHARHGGARCLGRLASPWAPRRTACSAAGSRQAAPSDTPAAACLQHAVCVAPQRAAFPPSQQQAQGHAVPRPGHEVGEEEEEVAQVGCTHTVIQVPARAGVRARRRLRSGRRQAAARLPAHTPCACEGFCDTGRGTSIRPRRVRAGRTRGVGGNQSRGR